MDIELTAVEARILGSVIEKAITTPDNYPLSLNAIVAACNQKTNREPVMALTEGEVVAGLDALVAKRLLWEKSPSGSRVTKYAHRLSNTLDISLSFLPRELGLLCALMLRGPQTIGELRGRTGRLCGFSSLEEVQETLDALSSHDDGPFVVMLEREPGRKEARYTHTLCGEPTGAVAPSAISQGSQPAAASPSPTGQPGARDRIAKLEGEVNALRAEIEALKQLRAQGNKNSPE